MATFTRICKWTRREACDLGHGLNFVAYGLNLTNEVFGFYQGATQFMIQREYYKPTIAAGFPLVAAAREIVATRERGRLRRSSGEFRPRLFSGSILLRIKQDLGGKNQGEPFMSRRSFRSSPGSDGRACAIAFLQGCAKSRPQIVQ